MKKLLRIAAYVMELTLAYICAFFLKCFSRDLRGVWIVSERGDDARDNGYFFFRYMREKHPQKRIYYVIDCASADYSKVQKLGNVIQYGSFRHFLFYALSAVRISSSAWGGDVPKADYRKKLRKLIPEKKKNVFLQHGIIKDYLPSLMYPNFTPDVFVCGAYPEYEYIRDNFKHDASVVKYLGLARFDNLHEYKEKTQILIMPTFRKWLQGIDRKEFVESEYYQRWDALLHNVELQHLLEITDMRIVFYPHYEIQKFVDCFTSYSSRVEIADFNHYDVQQLLMESKVLITDFSSVFFDFGYMEKPVIYYQFDRERYIKEHYDFTKGYFSYDHDGFGDVTKNEDDLTSAIEKCIHNNFRLAEKYARRLRAFFPLKDQNNCDRIYQCIEDLLKESD